MEGKNEKIMKMSGGPFFLSLFSFLFFFFSLFETTEICLGLTIMENFTGKNISRREKSGKVTLPLLKIFLLLHWYSVRKC